MAVENISLLTLKIILRVAECGSIGRAAAEMNIATSAASKRIRDLENELNAVLFHRQRTGLVITDAGKTLLDHARNLFLILERMQTNLAEFGEGLQGNVRLFANSSALLEFLPEELAAFARSYPKVRLVLEEKTSADVQRAVRDGLADVGIFAGEATIPHLEVFPFRRDHLVIVVGNRHPLAGRLSISFSDTLQYDHVGMQAGTSLHDLITAPVVRQERSINLIAMVSSFDALRRLIANGIGIGVMPEACVAPYAHLMGLRSVRLTDSWANRQLNLCVRSLGELPKSAQLLAQHLIDHGARPATEATQRRLVLTWSQ
ncbi:LysR substrate-binding domain-containing protein [Microvirga massiliensis]|uniref:LysR family transcriptional regulator n=1 Tax=Microvirga massiliensis TaxID=1033741 RepID=UPI00062B8F95|nr:LysR substrate-binding domain-containing protein [Microvirga massiliensis]